MNDSTEKWWLGLKSGDRVYVQMERKRNSGMAEVYGVSRKLIHVSLAGTPLRINKSDGCINSHPHTLVHKDEKDFMDFVLQRKRFCGVIAQMSALVSDRRTRLYAEDVSKIEVGLREIIKKLPEEI